MANPQPDKYIKISSELWDAFCRVRIAGEARQMLDTIIRKTYGYHKKEDSISTSQFMEATGLSRKSIEKTRKKLRDMNFITTHKKGGSQILTYSLQKDYEKWNATPKKGYPQKDTQLPSKKCKLPPKKVPNYPPKSSTQKIIDNTIYTYTKDMEFSQTFQDYLEMRIKIRRPATTKAQELVLKDLHKYDIKTAIAMLEQSIIGSWQGVYSLKDKGGKYGSDKRYPKSGSKKYDGISSKAE